MVSLDVIIKAVSRTVAEGYLSQDAAFTLIWHLSKMIKENENENDKL